MASKTLILSCLLSSLTPIAARQQHIRRQASNGIYLNSTASSSQTEQSSSSLYPAFSFEPQTTSIVASPAATLSTSQVASTLGPSHHGPGPIVPGSRSFPVPTATASSVYPGFSFKPTTSAVGNGSCGGATLNVLDASLDWWYSETIYDDVSTLSFQRDKAGSMTGWTIVGVGTRIEVSTAVTTQACDPEPTYWTYIDDDTNSTITESASICSNVPATIAPVTSGLTITGYIPPNSTTGTGFDDIPRYRTLPPPASATIANTTFDSNVPFVYFNAYEVVSSNFTRYANGDGACNYVTQTYNMSAPYAFSYTGPNPADATEEVTLVTGDLDGYLPTALGRPSLTAGSFTAVPTVIVVVDQVFMAAAVAYLAHTMFTATHLDVPTPTLPGGVSATTTADASGDNYNLYTSLTAGPRVEATNKFLLVPDASSSIPLVILQSQVTGATTQSPTSGGGTGLNGGSGQGINNAGSHQGGSGGNSNNGASKPADALDVLTAAVGSYILQGLGGKAAPAQTIDIAGAPATAATVSGFVVAGQTAVPGGPAITVGGTVISVPVSGDSIVVAGSTFAKPAAGGTITANSIQITEVPATIYSAAGQTLVPGGPAITISNTPVSLAAGGGAVVIGSTTSILQTRVITVGTQTVTANAATQFVFGPGETLTQGGTVIIGSTTVSLAQGATALVVNGQTTTIAVQSATARPALTVGGQIITANGAGAYVVSGQTLSAGGAVTFSGTNGVETVSLDTSGTVLVEIVSGKSTTTTLQATSAPVLTLGGQRFTALAGSTYVINGQTLTPGSARTVVVGGSTYILSLPAVPTVVEIDQVGPSGRVTATSYEILISSTAKPGSGTQNTSPSASAILPGKATTIAFELTSAIVACVSLFFAIWL